MGAENDQGLSLLLDLLEQVLLALVDGVLAQDESEEVLEEGVGGDSTEVPVESWQDHQLHFLEMGKLMLSPVAGSKTEAYDPKLPN